MDKTIIIIDFELYKLTGRKDSPKYPANDNAGRRPRSTPILGYTLDGSILIMNEYGQAIASAFQQAYFDNAGYRDAL